MPMNNLTNEELELIQKALRCYELDENLKQINRERAGISTQAHSDEHKALRSKVLTISMKLRELATKC
jgi:hypothetical protein